MRSRRAPARCLIDPARIPVGAAHFAGEGPGSRRVGAAWAVECQPVAIGARWPRSMCRAIGAGQRALQLRGLQRTPPAPALYIDPGGLAGPGGVEATRAPGGTSAVLHGNASRRKMRLRSTIGFRCGGHSGPMLNTCETMRVPGFNSRTSLGLRRSLRLCKQVQRDDRRLTDVWRRRVLRHEAHAIGHAGRGCGLGGLLDQGRIDLDTHAARAILFAAAITMRPSPEPRS